MNRSDLVLVGGLIALSCSAEGAGPGLLDPLAPSETIDAVDETTESDDSGLIVVPTPSTMPDAGADPLGRERCRAPKGVSRKPRTIEAAVQLLNALPKPTSVACFVESLARPLSIVVTSSPFSAQPALSKESPRVFIGIDQLWLSVVIDGESSYLIEFGFRPTADALTTVKGEVALPIAEALPPEAPYEHLLYGGGTVCGFCHANEQPAANVDLPGAFESEALRPRVESYVSVESLRSEHALCSWSETPHRCEMLSAIFDGGDVVEAAFPDTMATFF